MYQTSVFYDEKVKAAIDRLRIHEPPEGYYLAFSGGKDSVVVKDLAEKAGVEFEAVYNFTTADPPELVNFIREQHGDVRVSRPEISMWDLIPKKRMPPTRLVRYCCEFLKERGGAGRRVVTGIRWQESPSRSERGMFERCRSDRGKTFLHPVIDWTEGEVWSYIKSEGVDYCSLYDEGFDRLGCVMCPMQGRSGMLRDAKRWGKFEKAYLLAFDRMLKAREQAGLKTDDNWSTAEKVMRWWVDGS